MFERAPTTAETSQQAQSGESTLPGSSSSPHSALATQAQENSPFLPAIIATNPPCVPSNGDQDTTAKLLEQVSATLRPDGDYDPQLVIAQKDIEQTLVENNQFDTDPVRAYFREIVQTPLLARDEEKELALQKDAGSVSAFDHLVRANLRLVVSIAKKYHGGSMTLLDRIQEGNIGLLKAVWRYDVGRETRLSTFAHQAIHSEIIRALQNQDRSIRIPVNKHQEIKRFKKQVQRLEFILARTATLAELVKLTGFTQDKVVELLHLQDEILSLDKPMGVTGKPRREFVPSRQPSVGHELEVLDELETNLEKLDERERSVIELMYDLRTGELIRTRAEVGSILGVSATTVGTICKKIKEKYE